MFSILGIVGSFPGNQSYLLPSGTTTVALQTWLLSAWPPFLLHCPITVSSLHTHLQHITSWGPAQTPYTAPHLPHQRGHSPSSALKQHIRACQPRSCCTDSHPPSWGCKYRRQAFPSVSCPRGGRFENTRTWSKCHTNGGTHSPHLCFSLSASAHLVETGNLWCERCGRDFSESETWCLKGIKLSRGNKSSLCLWLPSGASPLPSC